MPDAVRGRRAGLLVTLASIAVLAGLWQLASVLVTGESAEGGSVVPGWQQVFGDAFAGLSDYWRGGLGIETVADGGERSHLTALLALGHHALITLQRLVLGLALGAVVGLGLALAVSWSPWTRRLVALPTDLVRALPLLAMIPLFALWFGISLGGMVLFTAYGTGVLFFAGMVNAVGNVPQRYVDNARTLGASKLRIYRTVILPATLPEMRSTILLGLGVAWSAVAGAEFLGAQDGLGHIIVYSQLYGFVDRMVVVALLFVVFAVVTYVAFDRLARRLTAWAPQPRSGR
jgi:sulfonate transport system permease protein